MSYYIETALYFVFKYLWAVMAGLVYICWSVYAIKQIITDPDNCDDATYSWIVSTVFGIFIASFVFWVWSIS